MNEYQIEIKVKNALILNKIKAKGYETVGAFCAAYKISTTAIGEIVNFKRSPLNKLGQFRDFVIKFCQLLDCLPEDIFTNTQITLEIESNKRAIQVNEAELQLQLDNIVPKLLEDQRLDDERNIAIESIFKFLTPREEKIIRERFGLCEDGEAKTLAKVAKHFNLSRNRIRAIEVVALRKLRHQRVTYNLRDFA